MTPQPSPHFLERQPMVATSAAFSSSTFPEADFLNPELVKAALGPYEIVTRYFDQSWNEVRVATHPGRYGAWIEARFASGMTERRTVTLFRASQAYAPVINPYDVLVRFPREFGFSEQTIENERWNINSLVNRMMDGELAAILACTLHERDVDPVRWRGFNYWFHEEAWWTTLKDKLGFGAPYSYLIRTPAGYDQDQTRRWPLILFLHGAYECGDDLNLLATQGPQGFVNQGGDLPFLVVSPQCPARSSWNPKKLMGLIDEVGTNYRVDSQRIYVTGLSMGGFSAFDLAACYPERIAAIAPLSAGESPEIADRLQHVPAWIFHGADDPIVSAQQSIEIARRLEATGAQVRLTILEGVGHGGWTEIYANPKLYAWFLQHVRT